MSLPGVHYKTSEAIAVIPLSRLLGEGSWEVAADNGTLVTGT